MRVKALAFAVSAAFAALTATEALAAQFSGDSRFDFVTSHAPEIEANPLASGMCEILVSYEWVRDPARPIMVGGSDDRHRYETWRGGNLDLATTPPTGDYSASLIFQYQDRVEKDGVRRQTYLAYLTLVQVGPFSVGQTFSLRPDQDDPGAATSNLSTTLTADDLAAATISGNDGYDHYQAQCGQ